MLFNSFGFIFLFLPTVFGVWYVLQRSSIRVANLFLILVSLGFYATLDAKHLPLLLFSVVVNFLLGMRLQRAVVDEDGVKKIVLILAVVFNLALLGASKYIVGFSVLSALGISFFTFHQLAYHVDIYRGRFRASGFLEYLLFVAFFPHMIAGPIVRPAQFMPQLAENSFRKSKITMGVMFFSIGLFKKTVFADGAAKIADSFFESNAGTGSFEAWSGVLAYGMQIYFDFSGYADMAIGVGLLFGIYLPLNFKNPYKATSMIEFWRRWHITLSEFVRDYLYIPLGGNRHGKFRQGFAILVAMTLIGVWHGSAWSFVAWGFLHGAALWVNHLLRGFWSESLIAKAGGFLMTFTTVTLLWVLFRSESFEAAIGFYKKLFLFDKNIVLFEGWWMLLLGYAVIFFGRSAAELVGYRMEGEKKLGVMDGLLVGVVLFLSFKMMMGEPSRSFVYFVF